MTKPTAVNTAEVQASVPVAAPPNPVSAPPKRGSLGGGVIVLLLATIMAFVALVMRILAMEFRLSALEGFFRKIVTNSQLPTEPNPPSNFAKFPPVPEETQSDISVDDLSDVAEEERPSDPSTAHKEIMRAFSETEQPQSDEEEPPAAPEPQPRSSRRRSS